MENWVNLLFETCERGVSSAYAPELLPDNQLAWGGNIDVRGGKPGTRPNICFRMDLPEGLFQGGEYFGVQGGMLVLSIGGRPYRIRINGATFASELITLPWYNSGVIKQVWMCQTVETLVIQDGQSNAILYNGSTAVRSTGDQVPRGRQMAYGNGRLWVAINAKELVAGDIRTREPGSELLFTETDYLTGGGSLYFPRGITGLSFIPVTGQADYGALLAYGQDYTEAIRADVTNRDQWGQVPGFVTGILRSVGSASQWSIVPVNQDLYWRDSNGGLRSIRNALADEAGPGSSPISREVSRLTDFDSQQLLPWCSGVYFDNRLLMTSSPCLLESGGIGWKNLISLDFSPLSTMQGKADAAYNGQWNGLTFLKLMGGSFLGKNRTFAVVADENGRNQLWEFGTPSRDDCSVQCTDGTATIEPYRITSWVEYPRRDFGQSKSRKRLERCDVWLSNVQGEIDLKVYWRADNSQKWLEWDEDTTCAKMTDPSTQTPHVWKNLLAQERPQFKTFTIAQNLNEMVGYDANIGFEFQIRLVWTGKLRIHRMMCYGTPLDDPNYAFRHTFQEACIENDVTGNEVIYKVPTTGCALCPIILTQPQPVEVFAPEPAVFTFEYEGVPESIQWQSSDDNGETWEDLEDSSPYSGVHTNTLTINPTGSYLSGKVFRCVLTRAGCAIATTNVGGDTGDGGLIVITPSLGETYFTSEYGSAELCGYDAYVDPEIPPRKWRTQTIGGFWRFCYNNNNCVSQQVRFSFVQIFDGSYTFDINDCAQNSGMMVTEGSNDTTPDYHNCDSIPIVTPFPIAGPGFGGPNNGGFPSCVLTSVTATEVTWVPKPGVCSCESDNLYFQGGVFKQLLNEDTEAEAIDRSTPSGSGSSNQSFRQTRGAGDFSFNWQDSTFHATASNLQVGNSYNIILELLTEDYGGGNGFNSQLIFSLTAAAGSEPLSIPIPCPPGKQVTASSPSIHVA